MLRSVGVARRGWGCFGGGKLCGQLARGRRSLLLLDAVLSLLVLCLLLLFLLLLLGRRRGRALRARHLLLALGQDALELR
jgi:hypothetical protein